MERPTSASLAVSGLAAFYGDFQALADIDLDIGTSRLVAVLGGNGAGKSTLLKVLGGELGFSRGSILVNGMNYTPRSPADALAMGVVGIHQELSLIDEWSVWEHFMFGRTRGLWLDRPYVESIAREALQRLDSTLDVRTRVSELSLADRQVVEIAKALNREPQLLLVDEPSAGLSSAARLRIYKALRKVTEAGCMVILATHDLQGALKLADDVVLLRAGRCVFRRPAQDLSLRDVLGDSDYVPAIPSSARRSEGNTLEIVIESCQGPIRLPVAAGSVVGVVCHPLSTAVDLLRGIAGIATSYDVTVWLNGVRIHGGPERRCQAGVVYVSREKPSEWLFTGHSIARNLNASVFARLARMAIMDTKRESEHARLWAERVRLVARSLDSDVSELSGGNRQKTVVARALATKPPVLLLDEPFTGIDASTRVTLQASLRDHAAAGNVVLVFSKEFIDIAGATDSILMFGQHLEDNRFVSASGLTGGELERAVEQLSSVQEVAEDHWRSSN